MDHRRTALREAAYIRRTRFTKGNDVLHDFSSRAEDLFMLSCLVPRTAGDWAHRPFLRWQFADEAADADEDPSTVRAWHVCADLKAGLTTGQWMDKVIDLVASCLPEGAVAEIAGHLPASKPAHAHILVAPRRAGLSRYGEIDYQLFDRLNVQLRMSWEGWLQE